jgi:dTMP kinase
MTNLKTVSGGLLIIFEGLDGAGKTTQLELAKDALTKQNYQVYSSHNLGGSVIGEELRKVLLSPVERPALTSFYIGVAVQEALSEVLGEQRRVGSIILLDRGPLSLVAYQSFVNDVDKDLAWQYGDQGISKFKPDKILLLNLAIEESLKRAHLRQGHAKRDYFESKPAEYFKRVNSLMQQGADRYSAISLDASKSIEDLHIDVMTQIIGSVEAKLKA